MWHAAHGWPVLFAIAGFAIVGRIVIITANIAAAIPMVVITNALFVLALCIVALLIILSIDSDYIQMFLQATSTIVVAN